MALDGLHDVGKEALAFLDEAILPHLVRHQTDEVGREEDLLDGGRIGQAGSRNLEATDKTIEDVGIQVLGILHQPNLLLRRVIVVPDVREAVTLADLHVVVFAIERDGDSARVHVAALEGTDALVGRHAFLGRTQREHASGTVSALVAAGTGGDRRRDGSNLSIDRDGCLSQT
jgi:hypothetical protein